MFHELRTPDWENLQGQLLHYARIAESENPRSRVTVFPPFTVVGGSYKQHQKRVQTLRLKWWNSILYQLGALSPFKIPIAAKKQRIFRLLEGIKDIEEPCKMGIINGLYFPPGRMASVSQVSDSGCRVCDGAPEIFGGTTVRT